MPHLVGSLDITCSWIATKKSLHKLHKVRNALVEMHNLLLGLCKLLFLLLFELCNVGVSPLHENGTNASRDRFSPAAPSSCA